MDWAAGLRILAGIAAWNDTGKNACPALFGAIAISLTLLPTRLTKLGPKDISRVTDVSPARTLTGMSAGKNFAARSSIHTFKKN
jgi:hypothetical protein